MFRGALLLTAVAVAGCGGSDGYRPVPIPPTPTSAAVPAEAPPASYADLHPRAHEDFRIPRSVGLRVHGLDLTDAVTNAMIDRLDGLAPATVGRILSRSQYAVWTIFCVDVEIEDGGVSEVYVNSGGDYAADAPAALRRIGAPLHATVVARANRIAYPSGRIPATTQARRRTHADGHPGLEPLDEAWSAAQAREGDIDRLVERYVRAHPRAFFYAG